jgi:poly(A) polymerase
LLPDEPWSPESLADTPWRRTLHILARLQQPTFAVALAALIREIPNAELPRRLFERWRLAGDELAGVVWILEQESLVRQARSTPWPKLQRVLVAPRAEELLGYVQAVAEVVDGSLDQVAFCRQKLALPPTELNPAPLITGEDLKELGIRPGPQYRELLEAARDAQLDGKIATREAALAMVNDLSAAR